MTRARIGGIVAAVSRHVGRVNIARPEGPKGVGAGGGGRLEPRAQAGGTSAGPKGPGRPEVPEGPKRVLPARFRLTWRRVLGTAALGSVIAGGAYVSTADPGVISRWQFEAYNRAVPLLRLVDPETAHETAVWAAKHALLPRERRPDRPVLATAVWGRQFQNPLGLAAGFDKNAEAVEGLLGLGFGFVEVGSVTPVPQEGNPRPRVFRLPEQKAVINRYGFNSEGIVAVAKRLGAQHGKRVQSQTRRAEGAGDDLREGKAGPGLVGVNLGKNKESPDAAADYIQGVHTLSQYADYLVINVSSPNTPGLRKLQGRKRLQELLKKVLAARDEMQWGEEGPPPLLVKIAPDLSKQDMADIAAVALVLHVDGLIIGNTTVQRPDAVLGLLNSDQAGGLSGAPLKDLATDVLRQMYRLTKGKVVLVGCGGISSGADAYERIRAGATLVQIWTSLAYEGPAVVPRIKDELAQLLERDGFKSVGDAVGADHR